MPLPRKFSFTPTLFATLGYERRIVERVQQTQSSDKGPCVCFLGPCDGPNAVLTLSWSMNSKGIWKSPSIALPSYARSPGVEIAHQKRSVPARWRDCSRNCGSRKVKLNHRMPIVRIASAAAEARFSTPSLAYICSRCLFTVRGLS